MAEILKAEISLQDPDQRTFTGFASVEGVDKDGEMIPIDEIARAMDGIMEADGPMTEKHSNRVIAKILKWHEDKKDGKRGIRIYGKVHKRGPTDDDVWKKMQLAKQTNGRLGYGGLSFGGRNHKREYVEKDGMIVPVLKAVEGFEITICDNQSNYDSNIDDVNMVAKDAETTREEALKTAQIATKLAAESLEKACAKKVDADKGGPGSGRRPGMGPAEQAEQLNEVRSLGEHRRFYDASRLAGMSHVEAMQDAKAQGMRSMISGESKKGGPGSGRKPGVAPVTSDIGPMDEEARQRRLGSMMTDPAAAGERAARRDERSNKMISEGSSEESPDDKNSKGDRMSDEKVEKTEKMDAPSAEGPTIESLQAENAKLKEQLSGMNKSDAKKGEDEEKPKSEESDAEKTSKMDDDKPEEKDEDTKKEAATESGTTMAATNDTEKKLTQAPEEEEVSAPTTEEGKDAETDQAGGHILEKQLNDMKKDMNKQLSEMKKSIDDVSKTTGNITKSLTPRPLQELASSGRDINKEINDGTLTFAAVHDMQVTDREHAESAVLGAG